MNKKRWAAVLAIMIAIVMMVTACSRSGQETAAGEKPNDPNRISHVQMLYGEMSDELEGFDLVELSEDQLAEMDRAMRAYTPGTGAPVFNNAEEFYYYERLTEEQQNIYDALYLLAMDPGTTNNIVTVYTDQDPKTPAFEEDFYVAWVALGDDHPELWWINIAGGDHGINTFIGQPQNGHNTVMLQMSEAYETVEEDAAAFNTAVENFMADIDPSLSDEEIALTVHDKLIELAAYDTETMLQDRADLAHTAYGAFIANSEGISNCCVCDGYSLAYEYILQQYGIPCTVARGRVEVPYPNGEQGGHAWNLVMIGDQWYEIDSTWDDQTTLLEEMSEQYPPGTDEYQFYEEMTSDEAYMELLEHNKYRLMTDEIQDFVSPDYLTFTSQNGLYGDPVGDSWRRRYCDYEETKSTPKGILTKLLPIADGTSTGGQSADQYEKIAGTYYVTEYNGADEEHLSEGYGEDYYLGLAMFELHADGTGVLIQKGQKMGFTFTFDEEFLEIYGDYGGYIQMLHDGGRFTLTEDNGDYYIFAKQEE